MPFSLGQLFTYGIVYLMILFGSAYATERGLIPRSVSRHPLVKVLSLGVFAGAVAFYGIIGLAYEFGSSFLLYFFGVSAAFLLTPLLLRKIGRIALPNKLGSIADLLVYRYPLPWLGGLVSFLMLLGMLPLLALQVQAVSITVHYLNQDVSTSTLALVFCATMSIFAILFGARHASTRDKHNGLILAMGIESLFKLIAFLAIGIYSIYGVFGGPAELNAWLVDNQELLAHAELELSDGPSRTLLLLFFAAAVAMPHIFHILFTENNDPRLLNLARWGFPAYMMLLSLAVPPILWASMHAGAASQAELFGISLGVVTNNPNMTLVGFIGGFAAASGVLIVSTLALSTMCVNHILLPVYRPSPEVDFFKFLLVARRIFIVSVLLLSYGLYRLLDTQQHLMSLGLVTFVAVLQFLPGLVGAFHWRRANRIGVAAGLLTGFGIWAGMLFVPLMSDILSSSQLGIPSLFQATENRWHVTSLASLSGNAFVFVLLSLITSQSQEEQTKADECASDLPIQPYQGELIANSAIEMEDALQQALGDAARREMDTALQFLGYSREERRGFALIRIRNELQANLTSMVGQTIAQRIISGYLPIHSQVTGERKPESVHSMEDRFEGFGSHLTGLAAELDNLRRYHRQTLQDLPTAVCTVDRDLKILTWNRAMEQLTGLEASDVIDHELSSLPDIWQTMFQEFILSDAIARSKQEAEIDGARRVFNLHKAMIEAAQNQDSVIVIEDVTDEQMLAQQLMHNQRLVSIGQLAAGVAHEVGNPITGIACLAQNMKIETEQPELLEISEQILVQTERISDILTSLVNFAHGGKPDEKRPRVPVRLKQCIDEAIGLLSLAKDPKEIRYRNHCPGHFYVLGDGQRLMQVFINVLSNARDASNPLGEVIVEANLRGDTIQVDITDFGHGISEENINQVFQPFFTTKDPGQGTGLGLAIVTTIVEEHQGTISATSSRGSGTRVSVRLPFYDHSGMELTSAMHSLLS